MADITTRTRKQSRLTKELIIIGLLLLIPLSVTIAAIAPMPAEFTTRGELVHVADVGIDGSVYFTYVENGVTENLYERFYTWLLYSRQGNSKGIEFTPISYDLRELIDEKAYGTAWLSQTVEHAVTAVISLTMDESDVELANVDDRVDNLLTELEGFFGDSLGLMVAIGLYEEENGISFADQLGLKIAGTGSMEYGGTVGSIGALKQKLLGAEMNDVDLYFIPDDYERYEEFSNVTEARQVIEEFDLQLDIVPVGTLQEAIEYLTAGRWDSL